MLKKPTFYDGIQLIQSHLYATTGFILREGPKGENFLQTKKTKCYMSRHRPFPFLTIILGDLKLYPVVALNWSYEII